MVVRLSVSILISLAIIEILLRLFLQLPDMAPYQFDLKSGMTLFRPEINATIGTRQIFSFQQNETPNTLPLFFNLTTDSFGSRVPSSETINFDSYNLLLGDSISLGWPVKYAESPLQHLNARLKKPVFNCSFLASGPVQIEKMLDNHLCIRSQKLQSAVVQITIHSQFAFPDSLFVDSAGENFQPLLIYLIHGSLNSTDPVNYADSAIVNEAMNFNDQYFNQFLPAIDKSYLAKTIYLLFRKAPKEAFFKITNWVNGTTPHDQRHEKTLTAILNIEKKLGLKPKIFISRTKESMQHHSERPEVERLKTELRKNNFHVFDMISHKNISAMPGQFYYINDLHPNAEGYKLIADELFKLFK